MSIKGATEISERDPEADHQAQGPAQDEAGTTGHGSKEDGPGPEDLGTIDAPRHEPQRGTRRTPPGRAPSPPQGGVDLPFLHRVTPIFKLLRLYSRLEVSGLERIGENGAILAANHTGWLGLDYAYTALSVYDGKKRIPRGMAHATWFKREATRGFARRLGLFEANKQTLRDMVLQDELVLLFPEGEQGAFKGDQKPYQLQPFARGYIRVAMETGVPVIPVAIIGGEEANPSSGQIDSYEKMLDLTLPMPQNLFPRPVKWAISFLEPITLEGGAEAAGDRDRVEEENQRVRSIIATELQRLQSLRGHPYL